MRKCDFFARRKSCADKSFPNLLTKNKILSIIDDMSDGISVAAPAKINLGLRVLEKRSDGFHGIQSVFQTVGLCDELFVTPLSEKNVCRVFCAQMELPKKNTLSAAYEACAEVLGQEIPGVEVTLTKRIPSGGGLGGGSSDAAALVFALKNLGVQISKDAAYKIASKVGSDVFFFLECEGQKNFAALVQGRGEVVKPIPPRDDLRWVLVFPEVFSSTPRAYAQIDEKRFREKTVIKFEACDLEKIYRRPIKDWSFTNDFTSVVAEEYQEVRRALDDVRSTGASFCDMTGSGSAVFGVYEDASCLVAAKRRLSDNWKAVSL